ncbi:DoxX family protein [Marivita hallyeonensis]|uniref:DoxX-like family protein n=1 Tax=Marivita hallyeonensis TaxID=996342 RepID=A0A1M5S6C3_9RHOB|nr:DoxX family protein [Marivita hallyeonensis]SHH33828.1 DoxX-like family protein [Marivita hallyeonensis]
MTAYSEPKTNQKWKTYAAWVAQMLLAVGFAVVGGQKLVSADSMAALFAQLSDGSWFMYLTGTLEVLAAGLLLFPATAFFGALIAGCVLFGALITHLFFIGGSIVPALVLLLLTAAVLVLRRPQKI